MECLKFECFWIVINLVFFWKFYGIILLVVLCDVVLDEFFFEDIDLKMWVNKLKILLRLEKVLFCVIDEVKNEFLVVEKFWLVFVVRDECLVFKRVKNVR